jgi:hypothetical protein
MSLILKKTNMERAPGRKASMRSPFPPTVVVKSQIWIVTWLVVIGFALLDAGRSLPSGRGTMLAVRDDSNRSLMLEHSNWNPQGAAPRVEPRAWTVMVYLNGDNNLEKEILSDFREMATVGSTDQVNIVAQLDRHPGYTQDGENDWSDTRRFWIKRGSEPTIQEAEPDFAGEIDMTSGTALRDFVAWARQRFPARRYALIIGSHGEGWRYYADRLDLGPAEEVRRIEEFDSAASLADTSGLVEVIPTDADIRNHPVRSITHDMTSGGKLYNREMQDALESVLAGEQLDLIGFDACLMAMLETAYALRRSANVMVASEENEPEEGWSYEDILTQLTASPEMDGEELAKEIVRAYGAAHPRHPGVTLSAIRLSLIAETANAVSDLADDLSRAMEAGEATRIATARQRCRSYAEEHKVNSIDIRCFTNQLRSLTTDSVLRSRAELVSESIGRVVIENHAGRSMQTPAFVSAGLAFYFPPSRRAWISDSSARDYRDGLPATQFPVQFVEDHRWDEFLAAYASHIR